MASLIPTPFRSDRLLLMAAMLVAVPGAGFSMQDAGHIPQVAGLDPRAGMVIPNPPFSLRGLSDLRKMSPDMVLQWQACLGRALDPGVAAEWQKHLREPAQEALPRYRYALFHGLGMASLRRLLDSYYKNIDHIKTEDVFALSPWVALGLRNAISGTLIDVTYPRTWYPIGFIMDVPLECIYKTAKEEALVPMEQHPYDQREFHGRFLFENPYSKEQEVAFKAMLEKYYKEHDIDKFDFESRIEALKKLKPEFDSEHSITRTMAYGPRSRSDLLLPEALLGDPQDTDRCHYNEVGFFSRTLDPERSVTIKAVAITDSGKYKTGVDKPDDRLDEFYEGQARILARSLKVPFYDLRRMYPGKAKGAETKEFKEGAPVSGR